MTAASKDMKEWTGKLVKLGFIAWHAGISGWVLTHQLSSIVKPYQKNVAATELFYTLSAKTTKASFEEYAGKLYQDELKQLIAMLKKHKFSYLVFPLYHPFERKNNRIYISLFFEEEEKWLKEMIQ